MDTTVLTGVMPQQDDQNDAYGQIELMPGRIAHNNRSRPPRPRQRQAFHKENR